MKKTEVGSDWFANAWLNIKGNAHALNVRGKGGFGRTLTEESLRRQADAVARGVEVFRIFVLEEEDTEVQIALLSGIVLAQSQVGIRCFAIRRKNYNNVNAPLVQLFGSDDFVVIDEQLVYVPHGTDGKTYILEFEPGEEWPTEAIRQAIHNVNEAAVNVPPTNIEVFLF